MREKEKNMVAPEILLQYISIFSKAFATKP